VVVAGGEADAGGEGRAGNPATWDEQVTDEEYGPAPSS
jgi:hypothetical protein